jgi:hypothetical protein
MGTLNGGQAARALDPSDWLLLLFNGVRQPLDRVRIQKSMFLFAERSKAPDGEKYEFQPYHYGPFSFGIYPDLERLVEQGLVRLEPDPAGSGSPSYGLTGPGRERVEEVRRRAPAERLELLGSLRDWVTARSFGNLLNDVYRMYPGYAVNSVFRRT